jgi:hypothetical protein
MESRDSWAGQSSGLQSRLKPLQWVVGLGEVDLLFNVSGYQDLLACATIIKDTH